MRRAGPEAAPVLTTVSPLWLQSKPWPFSMLWSHETSLFPKALLSSQAAFLQHQTQISSSQWWALELTKDHPDRAG